MLRIDCLINKLTLVVELSFELNVYLKFVLCHITEGDYRSPVKVILDGVATCNLE